MIGSTAKICTTEEKSPVEVRRKNAKMLDFCELACFPAFLARVWVVLMVRRVEIEVPTVVLLTVWRAGVPIMTLNGKSGVSEPP